jgi:hypothetical protein
MPLVGGFIAAFAVIRGIKARSLEDHPHRPDQTMDLAVTLRANQNGRFIKSLHALKPHTTL